MDVVNGRRRLGRADDGSSSPGRFIVHPVSRLDTLAGVAIKYGVEVADIKRMNGLVTDLQMFALEKLLIPRPGRHPPSNGESSHRGNGDGNNQRSDLDVLENFLPLKSKATQRRRSSSTTICILDSETEGTEMSVYRAGIAPNFDRDGSPNLSPVTEPLPFGKRNSKSFINGLLTENSDLIEELLLPESRNDGVIGYGDVSVRRLHKADVEPASPPPELILKEDNSNGGFSGRAGTNLALRPKSATRSTSPVNVDSPVDADMMLSNPNSVLMGVLSSVTDGLAAVRKLSPTLSLFSADTLSSIWPTSKWTLKPDLQPVTAAAITRPILDSLPNPITGRRSKAALD